MLGQRAVFERKNRWIGVNQLRKSMSEKRDEVGTEETSTLQWRGPRETLEGRC